MTCFLYCIEGVGVGIAKIGIASHPKQRLSSFSTMPFPVKLRRVREFSSTRMAALWESKILAEANRYREYGEWVMLDDRLDELFDQAGGVEPVADEKISTGRKMSDDDKSLLVRMLAVVRTHNDVSDIANISP